MAIRVNASDQQPRIEVRVHGDFVPWLESSAGTLAVTTYNSGKLALFSAPQGCLQSHIIRLARPMGLAYRDGRLAVATRDRILEFQVTYAAPQSSSGAADARVVELRPLGSHLTGRLDVHEMAYDRRGLVFANTRFNCLARPSDRASFRRAWTPSFITDRHAAGHDACHLNGLGLRGGRVAMVTSFGGGAEPGAWRGEERFHSGMLLNVPSSTVVAAGLCMPHSPRWHGGRWWLCNSGEGTLCRIDGAGGALHVVASLPGFTRGLAFAADRALVGLSRIRRRHVLDAPPVRRRFQRLSAGVWLLDPANGRVTGAMEFIRGGREVFDVAFLPGDR